MSESNLAIRILTDLAVVTSQVVIGVEVLPRFGLTREVDEVEHTLDYSALMGIYEQTPGLVADKLKAVLELAWECLRQLDKRGIIFAYDEAQNLADHSAKDEYPLSLLLDVFQSIQRKNIPLMLVLTGLPTLFPKLVEARTFAERMFRVIFLDHLDAGQSAKAIRKPIADERCPVAFGDVMVDHITTVSGGYPYFIQFVCRELYDVMLQRLDGGPESDVSMRAVVRKLDSDFFAGRWSRATDRQRDLLMVVARLENADAEFSVGEIVEGSEKHLRKPFSASHVSQMLSTLCDAGLIYKNRHGRYAFAVPLLGHFIRRQMNLPESRS